MANMDQAAPEQAAPEQDDDAIVDQIGALLQQLSPEKQQQIVMQLSQMMGEQAPAGEAVGDPNAGAMGVPMEHA